MHIDEVERILDDFERLLGRHNIQIARGSRLEDRMLFARQVRYVRQGEAQIPEGDSRPMWREMHGICDLALRIIRAEATQPAKFKCLEPWLRLFASTPAAQLAQTTPAVPGDQQSDKMFEFLVALALLPHIEDVASDRGDGRNPDLLFRYRGRKWGIACKRLYSTNSATFRDRVTEAIRQIEVSPAETGLVFVNLVNLIRHDEFWPFDTDSEQYVGMSGRAMRSLLDREWHRLGDETVGQTDADLSIAFRGMKAISGVVYYLATTCLTGSRRAPANTIVQHARYVDYMVSRRQAHDLLQFFQDGLENAK